MPEGLLGGCGCGQVRYRLQSAPMFVHCCHCHLCQQQTGSAFILHAFIETDRVELLSGQINFFPMPSGSGKPHIVARCHGCGTQIWSHYHDANKLSLIKVGTLDSPSALPPAAHVFTTTKLPWITIPPRVPTFEEFYDFKAFWPAEAFTRLCAVYP